MSDSLTRMLCGLSDFYRVLPGFTGFYRVLASFEWVTLGRRPVAMTGRRRLFLALGRRLIGLRSNAVDGVAYF